MEINVKAALVAERLKALYGKFSFENRNTKLLQDPFWSIVETILSQNTTFRNSHQAFTNLSSKYKTINELSTANVRDIEILIRAAGLYKAKAHRILHLADIVRSECDGDASLLLIGPYVEARKRLMNIEGIGPKTADVVLLFSCHYNIIPVDTHISRVTKRIGIVPQNANYETVKSALERGIRPSKRKYAHMALIKFGREICSARDPNHAACPFTDICDYYQSKKQL
jgi:endonuclease-3